MKEKKQNQVMHNKSKTEKLIPSFNDVLQNVRSNKGDKAGYILLINSFCAIKDMKTVFKREEIEGFFDVALEKAKENGGKYLLDCFIKIYRKKNKNYDTITGVINEKSYILANNFFNEGEICNSVALLESKDGVSNYEKWISNILTKNVLKKAENMECMISLLIVTSMIEIEKTMGGNCEHILYLFFRILAEKIGVEDKQDYLYLKQISKGLKENKFVSLFGSFTFLYKGVFSEIQKLNEDLKNKKIFIQEKNIQISLLKNELVNNSITINKLEAELKDAKNEIQTRKNELDEANNRNDVNKNKYLQSYLSLKKSFVDKIKHDIKLEIEGIEDISEGLDDTACKKIQRRIDNIYKILQKEGD